uniref:CHCH domain-containing protein n=1 Tax=Heliothis virescens TaxID=7102 RepID=A0A2A4JSI0_HELVI
MVPPSENIFSLFFRQNNRCKCHEQDTKVQVSKKVFRRSFGSSADDYVVRETAAIVRSHYEELGECSATLGRLVDALSCQLPPPEPHCAQLRRALLDCYGARTNQPLDCNHLVKALMQCAREHALNQHP